MVFGVLGFTSLARLRRLHLWLVLGGGRRRGGEVMSLALLMTFSTCDPFNKSVHIKASVLFVLILGDKLAKSGHVMHI